MTPTRSIAVTLVGLALVVSGCSDDDPNPDSASGHSSDPVREAIAESPPPESADWNGADAEFIAMMIPHHAQALDMSELAASRATDPQVQGLAAAIDTAQGLEILVYADWLTDHDLPAPELGHDQHHDMPGMLTDDQMTELSETSGADFDRLFLESMIGHHQGALDMASTALTEGEDVLVNEYASDVNAGQSAEIMRMEQMLVESASG